MIGKLGRGGVRRKRRDNGFALSNHHVRQLLYPDRNLRMQKCCEYSTVGTMTVHSISEVMTSRIKLPQNGATCSFRKRAAAIPSATTTVNDSAMSIRNTTSPSRLLLFLPYNWNNNCNIYSCNRRDYATTTKITKEVVKTTKKAATTKKSANTKVPAVKQTETTKKPTTKKKKIATEKKTATTKKITATTKKTATAKKEETAKKTAKKEETAKKTIATAKKPETAKKLEATKKPATAKKEEATKKPATAKKTTATAKKEKATKNLATAKKTSTAKKTAATAKKTAATAKKTAATAKKTATIQKEEATKKPATAEKTTATAKKTTATIQKTESTKKEEATKKPATAKRTTATTKRESSKKKEANTPTTAKKTTEKAIEATKKPATAKKEATTEKTTEKTTKKTAKTNETVATTSEAEEKQDTLTDDTSTPDRIDATDQSSPIMAKKKKATAKRKTSKSSKNVDSTSTTTTTIIDSTNDVDVEKLQQHHVVLLLSIQHFLRHESSWSELVHQVLKHGGQTFRTVSKRMYEDNIVPFTETIQQATTTDDDTGDDDGRNSQVTTVGSVVTSASNNSSLYDALEMLRDAGLSDANVVNQLMNVDKLNRTKLSGVVKIITEEESKCKDLEGRMDTTNSELSVLQKQLQQDETNKEDDRVDTDEDSNDETIQIQEDIDKLRRQLTVHQTMLDGVCNQLSLLRATRDVLVAPGLPDDVRQKIHHVVQAVREPVATAYAEYLRHVKAEVTRSDANDNDDSSDQLFVRSIVNRRTRSIDFHHRIPSLAARPATSTQLISRAHGRLFVHQIPTTTTNTTDVKGTSTTTKSSCIDEFQLAQIFLAQTFIHPVQVEEIVISGRYGRSTICFRTSHHAAAAFSCLRGTTFVDHHGYRHKHIHLVNGEELCVRETTKTADTEQHQQQHETRNDRHQQCQQDQRVVAVKNATTTTDNSRQHGSFAGTANMQQIKSKFDANI